SREAREDSHPGGVVGAHALPEVGVFGGGVPHDRSTSSSPMATWPRATGSAWNSWPTTAASQGATALVPSGSIVAATCVPRPLTSCVFRRGSRQWPGRYWAAGCRGVGVEVGPEDVGPVLV